MPDLVRRTTRPAPTDALVAAARTYSAAQITTATDVFRYDTWQKEAWHFWRTLGEVNYGLGWRAAAMSRLRLTAAEMIPGGEEPETLDTGPAADLMEQFYGGTAGQSAFLKTITTHLDVPGEGWLVAERYDPTIPLVEADWCVQSTESFRRRSAAGAPIFELRVDENAWRALLPDALPARIWEPDPEYPWRAFSPMQAAIPICRRIELLDRQIVARLLSRLALNGILLIPQEGTLATPAAFADAPDPFVAMLIDIASKNIANPGQASAALPIPIRFASELIEKWRWLTFGDPMDEQLLVERDGELSRLATTLNLSSERLSGGMGDVNHWGISQLEEGEVKTSIAPTAETIVGGVTKGYLHPMLRAAGKPLTGPNGGLIIVWYDTSELTAAPDKSKVTIELYDRGEASGSAARREAGLDESDAMTPDELADWGWKRLVPTVELGPTAISELSGQQDVPGAGASGPAAAPAPPVSTAPAPGAPPTQGEPAPTNTEPPQQQAAALSRIVRTGGTLLAGQQAQARALADLAARTGRLSTDLAVAAAKAPRNGKHVARHRR